jgi:hypothetical protein
VRQIRADPVGNAEKPTRPKWYTRLADRARSLKNRIREKFELSELKETALNDPFDGHGAVKELAGRSQFGMLADIAVNASVSENARDATYALFRHGLRNELAFVAAYAEKTGIRRFARRLIERQESEVA